MNEQGKTLGEMLSSFAPTGKAAEETLHAIYLGEADALVIETKNGPRVFTLRDANEPYRELVERMSGAAVIVSTDHTILYCNGALDRMLRRDGLAGSDLLDLVAPAQRGLAKEILIAGASTPSAAEVTLISADGGETPVRASAAPMTFDGQNCVALVVTALDDIEALKTSEAAVRESERRFQLALTGSPIVVFEQDLDLRYTWIYNVKFGYAAREFIGKTDADLMDGSCAARLTTIKRGVIETGQPVRLETVAGPPGGPLDDFDLMVEPRRNAAGEIIGVIGTATDITTHKRSEQALRDSQDRTQLAMEAAEVGIWEWNLIANTVRWDAQMFRMYGIAPTPDGMVPYRAWADALGPDELARQEELSRQHAREGGVYHREFRIRRCDDGEIRVIHAVERVRVSADGRVESFVGTNRDITERKRAELALRESEERKSFLLELGDALKPLLDPDDIKEAACESLGRHIGGNQVLYAEIDPTDTFGIVSRDWSDGSMASNVGVHRLVEFGAQFIDGLRAEKTVFIDDVRADPRTCSPEAQATFRASNIAAFISVPLVKNGRLISVLSVHSHSVRRWSALDVSLVEEVGDRTWAAVERARAEQALRTSDGYSRSLFESSPDCVKVMSLDGRLEQMNGNGRCALEIDDFESVRGRYWPDLWPPETRAGLEAAMAEARTGRTAHFSGFCRTLKGAPKWWDVMITAVPGADGSPARLIASSRDVTERRKTEETLRKNEALMSLAADAARMTYAEFDFKSGRLYLAENFARVMGYMPSDVGDKTTLAEIVAKFLEHVDPEDHSIVQTTARDFLAGRRDGAVTYRVIGDRGARRWIEGRWSVETDSSGAPSRGLAVNMDITERKQAEESLRGNQQRSQLATEATGVGVWEWNLKTNAVWWDRQMFSIYGHPPTRDGMMSFDIWAAFVLPEDLPEQVKLLRKHAREGGINRREFRIRRKDNQEIRVIEAVETSRSGIGGQIEYVVGTNLDVTERKRSELALIESDKRLRVALSSAEAAAWQWNIATNELTWSPECYEMYGRDPERDLARYELWRACLFPEDLEPTERVVRRLIDQGATEYRCQYRVMLPSGDIRWLAALGKLEYGADGKPLRMSGINLDITQQKRAEQQLAAAKVEAEHADRAKSRFLAAASHDLRQPVQSLVLLLSIMERQAQAAGLAKMVDTVKMMQSAVGSLNGLLSGILDISRLDAGVVEPEMQTVDVAAIIENLTDEYRAKAADKGLEIRAAGKVLWARSDPTLLQRVLRNLMENALRYTKEGGVLVGARPRGGRVRIDVVDTGIGVAEDQQKHIFEEFFQANNPGRDYGEGLGLGLAIVSRLAKLLGAEVEVRSRLGRGSRFSLLLPRAQDAGLVEARAEDVRKLDARILVVEDNSIVRQALVSMLEEWGGHPSATASGEEALDLAVRGEWRFDAMIVDHRLGAGLTGVQTALQIGRCIGRRVPTLVLTGDTAKERIAEIESSGFVFLHKPVDAESLLHELAQLTSG
ncbi:PAS domain S-box protein [Rhodoblastus sp.]|uniref:PAS domain S-box protein n=1 Tax=Rhodoblastus sp. TaxID=1962975 RepID=UPI003F947E79